LSSCKVCSHPKREYVEKEVLSGRQNIAWGAEKLGIEYQDFWTHLQTHVGTKDDAKFTGTVSDMLNEIIAELYKRYKRLVVKPVDEVNERDIKACVDSINTCVMNIAKLKKIIAPGPQIQIQQFNIQLTKLIEFLHTELPQEYQHKVEEFLEKMR